jgi:endonuclease-3
MPSRPSDKARAGKVIARLKRAYPDAGCSLNYRDPLQLIVATILSAQCTDQRVNKVTPALFAKYKTAADYAAASQEEMERAIQSTGFFRNKAKSIRTMAAQLVESHHGKVPRTMEELTALAGVGRKTANVVLGNAFGLNHGIVVDTHVARLTRRLGFTAADDPVKIERDLMKLVPENQWTLWPHLLIHHGRAVCMARKPACQRCVLVQLCPSAFAVK